MINNIDRRLKEIAAERRPALMAHAVIGYPTLEESKRLVRAMEEVGVDLVELQIPFSDPLADGPTIQRACEQSLASGVKVGDAFKIAAELSEETSLPLLFMTYYNIVYKYGVDKFCSDARAAGIAGLIVPDVPLEAAEHEGFAAAYKRHMLHNIVTLAPTSTEERIEKNGVVATGFVYCMSRQGVTGAHQALDPELDIYLRRVRQHIKLPLAVGFGISDKDRLRSVAPFADIIVVGSAIIDEMAKAGTGKAVSAAIKLVSTLTTEVRATARD